jgi:hypothetical protein
MSLREKCENLLDALMEAIEVARELLSVGDEDVKVFAIDAIQNFSEKAMLLMAYLAKESRTSGRSYENPLPRRVRKT